MRVCGQSFQSETFDFNGKEISPKLRVDDPATQVSAGASSGREASHSLFAASAACGRAGGAQPCSQGQAPRLCRCRNCRAPGFPSRLPSARACWCADFGLDGIMDGQVGEVESDFLVREGGEAFGKVVFTMQLVTGTGEAPAQA